MGLFNKKRDRTPQRDERESIPADQLVKDFLRGQNLEQVGKVDEAVSLYEAILEEGFDAAGPYDRLIFIYQQRLMHHEVIRVAESSLRSVKTYAQKQLWYRAQIMKAREQLAAPAFEEEP